MPYHVGSSDECPENRPHAVLKDDDGELMGCHDSEESAREQIAALMADEADSDASAGEQPFRMLLALVDEPTSDKRMMADFATREPPLTVFAQHENLPGHEHAPIVGRIDYGVKIGAERWGYGMLDAVGTHGAETIRLIRGSFLRGVSVDTAAAEVDLGEDGVVTYSGIECGAVTIVAFPAFRDCQIELLDELPELEALLAADGVEPMDVVAGRESSGDVLEVASLDGAMDLGLGLVASAVELDTYRPPAEWFATPDHRQREPFRVDESLRISGHAVGWNECHIGSPPGQCIRVPRDVDLSRFLDPDGRGVLADNGEIMDTGPIVLDADHANRALPWLAAADHYAHSGCAVADVRVGKDEHGIWVAGAVRPGVTPEHVYALRAGHVSVDCRDIGGRLGLIALLSVNTGGYARSSRSVLSLFVSGGRIRTLIASAATADCSCHMTDERLAHLEAELAVMRPLAVQALDAEMA